MCKYKKRKAGSIRQQGDSGRHRRPPPTKPPQLAYKSPTYHFAYMGKREDEKKECIISLQELAHREKTGSTLYNKIKVVRQEGNLFAIRGAQDLGDHNVIQNQSIVNKQLFKPIKIHCVTSPYSSPQ